MSFSQFRVSKRARAWGVVLGCFSGNQLLDFRIAPAFMRSSREHLALFREEVARRAGLTPSSALERIFLREATNFSPSEYRLYVTLQSGTRSTLFYPVVIGRTYMFPGRVKEEREVGESQGAQQSRLSLRVELIYANSRVEDLLFRDCWLPRNALFFAHPEATWVMLLLYDHEARPCSGERSLGPVVEYRTGPGPSRYPGEEHRDLSKALRDTWFKGKS